ncbi:MAG TPA: GAF domain-containing protein [Anaerolineae bacterium]
MSRQHLTAETAVRRLVRKVPDWRRVTHLGMQSILFARLFLALLVLARALTVPDYKPGWIAPLIIPTAIAFLGYATAQFIIWGRFRYRLGMQRVRWMQAILDLLFASLITFTSSAPGVPASLAFALPIALVAWYSSFSSTAITVALSLVASFGIDAVLQLPAGLWSPALRIIVFCGLGAVLQHMRVITLQQLIEEAKREVETSDTNAYLISSDFTLLLSNARLARRHGPSLLNQKCYQYLAGADQPCADCPLKIAIENDTVGERAQLTFRDKTGLAYPVEVTGVRVRGHDSLGRAQGARAIANSVRAAGTGFEIPAEERAQLIELAHTAGLQIEALLELGSVALGQESRELPDILRQVRDQVGKIINVDSWYIALYDRRVNTVEFPAYYRRQQPESYRTREWSDLGYTEWVICHNRPLLISDTITSHDTQSPQSAPGIHDDFPCRCWAGAPLSVQGRVFGVMAMQSDNPGFYSDADLQLLNLCAAQVSLVLAGVLRRQALLHGEDVNRWGLAGVATTPTAETVEALLGPIFAVIQQLIDYDAISVQRAEGDHLRIVASDGFANPGDVRRLEFDLNGDYPNAEAYRTRRVRYSGDIRTEFASFSDPGLCVGRPASDPLPDQHARSWLGIPLLRQPSGDPVGVLALDKFQPDFYSGLHAARAVIIAPFIADRIVKTYDYLQRWIRADRYAVLKLLNGYLSAGDRRDLHYLDVAALLISDAFGMNVGFLIEEAGKFRLVNWVAAHGEERFPAPPEFELHPVDSASSPMREVEGISGLLCMAIMLGGQRFGWLCGAPHDPGSRLDAEDYSILNSAANLLAAHLVDPMLETVHDSNLTTSTTDRDALEDLLDVVETGALSENPDGIITHANESLLTLLGYTRDEVIGQHFLSFVPESQQEAVRREWAKRPNGIASQYSTMLRRKDGSAIPVRVSAQPKMDGGRLKHVVVLFTAPYSYLRRQRLYDELARAAGALHREGAPTPSHALRSVRDSLKACGFESMIVQLDAEGRRLRVRDVSAGSDLVQQINRMYRVQLLGLEFSLADSPRWQEAMTRQQPLYERDGTRLLAEIARAYTSSRNVRRLTTALKAGRPAIVVPMTDPAGTCWALSVWGQSLCSEDVAPIAAYWREAADALALAEDRLRDQNRWAPNAYLFHARHHLKPWIVAILQLARAQTHSNSIALLGLNGEAGKLYPVAVDPIYASQDPETYEQPLQRGLAGWAAMSGKPMVANDVWADPYFEPILPEEREVMAEIAVPIQVRGSVVAVLDCQSLHKYAYAPEDQNNIINLAVQIGQAIEQAINTRWIGLEQSLGELENRLSLDDDARALYPMYLHLIGDVLSAEECSLWLTSPDRTILTIEASKRIHPAKFQSLQHRIGADDGIGLLGYVAASGKPLRRAGAYIREHRAWRGEDIGQFDHLASGQRESLLAVPIPDPDGRLPCAGVLLCENKIGPGDPPQFTGADETRLKEFAQIIGAHLPTRHAQAARLRQINEEIRQAYKDQIHDVRGDLYVATCWTLYRLVKQWREIPDRVRLEKIKEVAQVLSRSMSTLHSVEAQVVTDTDTRGRIGSPLRILATKDGLGRCTAFEGCIDDYPFTDKRMAAALIQFAKEALQNAVKYSKVDPDRDYQIRVRLEIEPKWAILSVEDQGTGMTREPLPTDFEVLRNVLKPVHGTLEVRNRPAFGRGFLVIARVPLEMPVNAGDSLRVSAR